MFTKQSGFILFLLSVIFLHIFAVESYGLGLGVNNLTEAWWYTPGHHYVPDGRTPVYYGMEVYSYDDLYVYGDGSVKDYSGQGEIIPSEWVVERVGSNIRGELEVTGSTEQFFFLEGTQYERLTFVWKVTPAAGYEWPRAYRLNGVAHGYTDPQGGYGAVPAVGAWFKIRDPHRQFTANASAYMDYRKIVKDPPDTPEPKFSPQYGNEKEYYQDDYAPWIDEGDIIIIEVPSNQYTHCSLQWSPPVYGCYESWEEIPPEGIGDSQFLTHGSDDIDSTPTRLFPDEYEHWQHYCEHSWPQWQNPWPCNVFSSVEGLSFGALCADIVTMDFNSFPLHDGIDESGTGLYGPGYVGRIFYGPAPAPGFLRLYLAGSEGNFRGSLMLQGIGVSMEIPGDITGDNVVNMSDFAVLAEHWMEGTEEKVCDLNDDNAVNLADFAVFALHWPDTSCDAWNNWCDGADTNGDGRVDIEDLGDFTIEWLENGCGDCGGADLTGDNAVNFDDLLELTGNWLGGF